MKAPALACSLCVAAAAHAADSLVLVNAANDGPSGQHTLKVMREAIFKAEPSAEARMKSFVVLEEPAGQAPPSPKQILGEVSRLINEAKAAYNRANLDAATEAIAQAEAMAMSTEPWPENFVALAELERLTGLIALKQKDSPAADEAFGNAFKLNPQLTTLDSAMGVYARMLKSKDRGTGQMVIRVDPITAWVMIDGQKAQSGVTPQLEAGTHFVSASREGYSGQIQRISVGKGKTVTVTFALQESTNEPDLIVARATVLAAQSDGALALGAKRVAELTRARFVVLVRPDDAALYDAANARLGTFEKVEKAIDSALQALKGATPAPLITDAEVKAIEDKRADEAKAVADSGPFYKKGWFIGVAAGVGVAIIAGVVAGAVVASNHPPTYRINSWCHASDCPTSTSP